MERMTGYDVFVILVVLAMACTVFMAITRTADTRRS